MLDIFTLGMATGLQSDLEEARKTTGASYQADVNESSATMDSLATSVESAIHAVENTVSSAVSAVAGAFSSSSPSSSSCQSESEADAAQVAKKLMQNA